MAGRAPALSILMPETIWFVVGAAFNFTNTALPRGSINNTSGFMV